MLLTQEQITRLSRLTALHDTKSLSVDSVLESFSTLSQTNTDSVVSMTRNGADELILRPDIVREDTSLPDRLLDASHQRKAAHQIVLGGIMQGES